MCSVWLSEQRVTYALYITNRLDYITEVESVYCAVRIESLYNTDTPYLERVKTCRKCVNFMLVILLCFT